MIPQTHAGTRTPACPGGGRARGLPETGLAALSRPTAIAAHGMWPISTSIFSAFGGVPSGPACSPVGIVPLWLGAFGERACWRDVGLLVVSGFAGGKSFAGEALFEFCW